MQAEVVICITLFKKFIPLLILSFLPMLLKWIRSQTWGYSSLGLVVMSWGISSELMMKSILHMTLDSNSIIQIALSICSVIELRLFEYRISWIKVMTLPTITELVRGSLSFYLMMRKSLTSFDSSCPISALEVPAFWKYFSILGLLSTVLTIYFIFRMQESMVVASLCWLWKTIVLDYRGLISNSRGGYCNFGFSGNIGVNGITFCSPFKVDCVNWLFIRILLKQYYLL